jgi:hypothetical protein
MLVKIDQFQGNLEFDYNSMCLIEESMGMSVLEILDNQEKIGLRAIRSFLFAGLYKNHGFTEEHIGDMLSALMKKKGQNGLRAVTNTVVNVMKNSELLRSENNNGPSEKKRTHQNHSRKQ